MKPIKSTLLLLLLLLGTMTASIARADHGHGGFRGGFRGFHGPHVGVFIDPWPLLFPFAAYPYGYYPYGAYPYVAYPPAVVTQQAAPTVYMEQGTSEPAQGNIPQYNQSASPSNDWYYCRKPEGYYPYVRNCQDGWQRVPAQPPTQH